MKQELNKDRPKLILIEWTDVQSIDTGLIDIDSFEIEPIKAQIVGFLVRETDTAYYVAKEFWESWQCKYLHIIPKNSAIVRVQLLQESDKIIKKIKKKVV